MAWRERGRTRAPSIFIYAHSMPAGSPAGISIYSTYRHHHRWIACGAVGDGALFLAGLHCAGAVCGAGHERVVADVRRRPLRCPEDPGVGRELRQQLCLLPRDAAISAYFDLLNAAIAREGDAADLRCLSERCLLSGSVDAAHRVERTVVPALVGVEPTHELVVRE